VAAAGLTDHRLLTSHNTQTDLHPLAHNRQTRLMPYSFWMWYGTPVNRRTTFQAEETNDSHQHLNFSW